MEAKEIKKIAVIGAGVIGNSWTTNFVWKGYPVSLWLFKPEEEEIARQEIHVHLENLVINGVIGKEEIPDMMKLITY
ncbi:MAG: 3-hydroxyacyl-CoA dehydrogenase NAD-binding domain-containing protein, partial [Candidatus Thorarchaeota archaeon]